MLVHLVHAHPEPRSFVAGMRDTIIEELCARGDQVTISDLYKMNFNPVLSGNDFAARAQPDYLQYSVEQRYSLERGTLAPDIQREVERVLAADILAFTFPIYWFSMPAILKGWIDRVFIAGEFYGGRRVYDQGGLAGKRAFAAVSLGGRAHMFGSRGIHGELETRLLSHFFQGSLGYVGLTVHKPFVAYHLPYISAADRLATLTNLREFVRKLDDQPVFEFPQLEAFDSTFAPLPDRHL